MLQPEDLYHTGIVVSDFEKALKEMEAVGGYRFAEEARMDARVRTPAGDTVLPLRATYSCAPGPLVELIEEVPGSHWTAVPGSGLHHLGYWADDVEAESAALVAAGLPFEAAGLGQNGGLVWAYHSDGVRPRIEIVSRAAKPNLESWTTTGRRPTR